VLYERHLPGDHAVQLSREAAAVYSRPTKVSTDNLATWHRDYLLITDRTLLLTLWESVQCSSEQLPRNATRRALLYKAQGESTVTVSDTPASPGEIVHWHQTVTDS